MFCFFFSYISLFHSLVLFWLDDFELGGFVFVVGYIIKYPSSFFLVSNIVTFAYGLCN